MKGIAVRVDAILVSVSLLMSPCLAKLIATKSYSSTEVATTRSEQRFSDDELDELLSPIALYPDPLLAQAVPAATFIDQLEEANKVLGGKSDDNLIASQSWDVSVKSVAHYPQVLQMMVDKSDWTATLGQAFVNQSTDVGKSIQRLRAEAKAAGNLATSPQQRESPVTAIAGSILGLLGFMLAFTFSIASDRYDAKKGLVREEANVLRTAWQRSDFLQEPDRTKTKALLRDYVDNRIALAQSGDRNRAEGSVSGATRSQHEMWATAVQSAKTDPFMNSDIGAMYLESINQVADLNALLVNQGLQARVPTGIWFVLYSLLVMGMMAVGYQTVMADSRRSRVTGVLAISFSLVIALIAALDHPLNGFISISQQPLVSLQTEMKSTP